MLNGSLRLTRSVICRSMNRRATSAPTATKYRPPCEADEGSIVQMIAVASPKTTTAPSHRPTLRRVASASAACRRDTVSPRQKGLQKDANSIQTCHDSGESPARTAVQRRHREHLLTGLPAAPPVIMD